MFRLINRAQARLRLPPPYAPFQRRHSSRKASDPLRILFCGSDAFSCESLRALHREHVKNRALVEALDVMVLPGRRTGRGLRTVHEGEDSAPPSFLSLCLIIWASKFLALLLHSCLFFKPPAVKVHAAKYCLRTEAVLHHDASTRPRADIVVPCKILAEQLNLPIHQRETFRKWDVSPPA